MKRVIGGGLLLLVTFAFPVFAEESEKRGNALGPLDIPQVVESVKRSYPSLLAALI